MKSCPKCNSQHAKPGIYCSRTCANAREWPLEKRLKLSIIAKNSPKVKAANELRRKKSISTRTSTVYLERPKKRVAITCKLCKQNFNVMPYEQTKRIFCSGKCRNIFNNKNICGKRSKAELLLQKAISENFPNLNVIYNDRELCNGLELDVLIPDLNLAIEWNGIFHYRQTKGNILEQYIKKDNIKQKICKEKNIKLIVIKDLTSSNTFIKTQINTIIKTILNMYMV